MRRFLTVLLLLTAFHSYVSAQISLEECRELARKNHPAIRMYGLIGATRDYSLSNASMTWLPSIHIGALAGLNNNVSSIEDLFSNMTDPELYHYWVDEVLRSQIHIQDPSPYVYKVQGELSQNLYDGGISRFSKRYAEAEARYEMAETDVTLENVCNRIDDIYFSILLLEKRIMQTDSRIEVLTTSRNRVFSLMESGIARQDEADAMDAACIEAGQQKAALETSVKYFRAALSLLTGQDMSSVLLSVPSRPSQPTIAQQVLMLDRKIDLLALEKEKVKIACRPKVEFIADAYYGFPNRNVFSDIVSHAPTWNAFLGLRLSWNLSAFYPRKNKLAIIAGSIEQINVKKDILNLDISLRNNSANFEMERLQKCIEKDNDLVTLRERLRKTAELSFSQGEIRADDLISRVNDEYQARLNADIHEIENLREAFKLRQ